MLNDSADNENNSTAAVGPLGPARFFSHSTRLFSHYVPTEYVLLAVVEFFVLMTAYYVGIDLRFTEQVWENRLGDFLAHALVFTIVMQLSLVAFGGYQRQHDEPGAMIAARVGASMMLGMLILSLAFYVAPTFMLGRGAFALAVFVSFVFIMMVRLVFRRISNAYDIRMRVLVLGAGETASLIKTAEANGELSGLNMVGFMPMPGDRDTDSRISMANTPGALIKYVASNNVDAIVLAMDERREGLPVHE